MNPLSRELGRTLREAQNDVLAAIGVVEVVDRKPPPSSEQLQHINQRVEKLDKLEVEDTVGNVVALFFAISEYACGWWIGCLRDRILVSLQATLCRYSAYVP